MTLAIMSLQIAVSLIYFTNKVFILLNKKVGWLVGAIAASLATIYFSLIGLHVYVTLNVGLIILMGYGFLKGEKKKPKVETFIKIVTIAVMFIMAYHTFTGAITIVELISSLALTAGTYYLTHNSKRLGWFLFCVGHATAVYIGYAKNQNFFGDFQIASVIISIFGMFEKK